MNQASSLQEWVQRERMQRGGTRVITITSGKGGSGKTSFTVNVAIELARLGKRVLILDADFGLANVDVMMGHPARFNLSHVIKEELSINEVIYDGHFGVRFISGGSGVEELVNLSEQQINALINAMSELEDSLDIILIDTGAGINPSMLRMVRAASETLIVTTPEPTAIIDAYALVKTLCLGEEKPAIRMVINKVESEAEAKLTMQSFSRIVQKYINAPIEELGYVSQDPNVTRSVKAQLPLVMGYPRSVAARDYARLARALIDAPEPSVQGGLSRFFTRMTRRGE